MNRLKKFLIIFGTSIFLGILFGSLFRSSYFNELKAVMDRYSTDVVNHSLYMGAGENIVLFVKIIVKRGIPFIMLWILSDNKRFRMPFILWICISEGFMLGFMCQFFVYSYPELAIKLIPAYFFPHYLMYIVAYGLSMLYITSDLSRRKGVLIMLLSILMIAGAAAETLVNPELLAGVLQQII